MNLVQEVPNDGSNAVSLLRAAKDSEFSSFKYSQQMRDRPSSGNDKIAGRELPRGITAVGVFLFFGATMASLAGTTLTWPGTSLG
jgi:hypothetical protein